jgi:hypothetical protein
MQEKNAPRRRRRHYFVTCEPRPRTETRTIVVTSEATESDFLEPCGRGFGWG